MPNEIETEQYPEHTKLRGMRQEQAFAQSFYDFIGEQGWALAKPHVHTTDCRMMGGCGWSTEELMEITLSPEAIIGRFLGIDSKKLSAEKDAMVAEMQRKMDLP